MKSELGNSNNDNYEGEKDKDKDYEKSKSNFDKNKNDNNVNGYDMIDKHDIDNIDNNSNKNNNKIINDRISNNLDSNNSQIFNRTTNHSNNFPNYYNVHHSRLNQYTSTQYGESEHSTFSRDSKTDLYSSYKPEPHRDEPNSDRLQTHRSSSASRLPDPSDSVRDRRHLNSYHQSASPPPSQHHQHQYHPYDYHASPWLNTSYNHHNRNYAPSPPSPPPFQHHQPPLPHSYSRNIDLNANLPNSSHYPPPSRNSSGYYSDHYQRFEHSGAHPYPPEIPPGYDYRDSYPPHNHNLDHNYHNRGLGSYKNPHDYQYDRNNRDKSKLSEHSTLDKPGRNKSLKYDDDKTDLRSSNPITTSTNKTATNKSKDKVKGKKIVRKFVADDVKDEISRRIRNKELTIRQAAKIYFVSITSAYNYAHMRAGATETSDASSKQSIKSNADKNSEESINSIDEANPVDKLEQEKDDANCSD